MRERGSVDDTWEEDELPAKGCGPLDSVTLDAAKQWLARATGERLQIHQRATEPAHAERQMAFAALAAELLRATGHLRLLVELGERLKAENTVLRKALTRQRLVKADQPAIQSVPCGDEG